VRETINHQSLSAPEGVISIDPSTHHTWRPVYIGRMRHDGQFDIVWTSQKPVRPVPYPISRSRAEWDTFLNELYTRWGNRWSNPVDERRSTPPPG
jgi:urea transport system substrate-binding protein